MNLEIAEAAAAELAQLFVMIAGHVDDTRAMLGLAEDGAQHVVVDLRPVETAAHAPEVDDVPDQEQLLHLYVAQKIEHQLGPALA